MAGRGGGCEMLEPLRRTIYHVVPAGGFPFGMAVGDVDGDRFADLVLVAADRTRIYTRRQRFVCGRSA